MKITILGSGTSIPHSRRAPPGFVVDLQETLALVDPGAGSLHRMAQVGFQLDRLGWVLATHFHLDHTGDLAPLLFALRNSQFDGAPPLTLVGPPGLVDHLRALQRVYGDWVRLPPGRLRFEEVLQGEVALPGCRLQVFPVRHADPSIGMRFTGGDGRIFAYSGDTDYCPELVELSREADLALFEASFPGPLKVDGHLTPELAGRAAREAGVRRLILTHLYPVCDEFDLLAELRLSGYTGPSEIAFDGMRIEV